MALKEDLLLFFSENAGKVYSGESLAETFSVTRAAVWKSIQQLRNEGFLIESLGGKGYCFSAQNDILNETLIREAAGNSTFPLMIFDTIDSTNTFAKKLCADHAEHGTFIVANHQTAGRGRRGHSFYSPANTGLYMSVILHPEKPASQLLKMTVAAGVASCRAIRECTSDEPKIKWVNDIFLGNQKVAGILTEATTDFETQCVDSVIVGVGINCRTIQFPDELKTIAGSLHDTSLSRSRLAGQFYHELLKLTENLDDPDLMQQYRELSLLLGKTVTFERNQVIYEGTAVSINDEGNLIISMADGEKMTLSSGEVSVKSWSSEL